MKNDIHGLVDQFASGRISRRELMAGIASLVAMASGTKLLGAESAPASTFEATGYNHLALRVTDVPRSRDFYIKHLGLTVSRDGGGNSCFLTFGNAFLALFRGPEARMDHYCYSVKDYDVRAAEEKLKAAGFTPRVTANRIYFPDPDGLTVQLAAGDHTP